MTSDAALPTASRAGSSPAAPADGPPADGSHADGSLADGRRRGLLARTGGELAYLLLGLPLAIISFVVLVTGLSLSLSLLIIWVGLPLGVLTLMAARGLAATERARLRLLDVTIDAPLPPGRGMPGSPVRRWTAWVRDRQAWLDVLHGLVTFPLAVATSSIALTWLAGALGGLTYWFWSRWLPTSPENVTLVDLLDLPFSESWLNLLLGIFFALTLVPVLRVASALHVAVARLLLDNPNLRALERRVQTLTESRAAAAAAEAQALRTLERDIHDGPQQRLVRLGMDLSAAERRLALDPESARELVAAARVQTTEALAELRALSRGIAPPVLADRGLAAALAGVAARCTVPVDLHVGLAPGERLPAVAETTAYFVVSEALTNVAKHSGATAAHVRVERDARTLFVRVEDDGVGGASPAKGTGLAGLVARVAGVDGALTITSPEGGPTVVAASVPCG